MNDGVLKGMLVPYDHLEGGEAAKVADDIEDVV
jgi:hypothetical protein